MNKSNSVPSETHPLYQTGRQRPAHKLDAGHSYSQWKLGAEATQDLEPSASSKPWASEVWSWRAPSGRLLRRQSRGAGGGARRCLEKTQRLLPRSELVKVIVFNLEALIKVQCLINLKPAVMITVLSFALIVHFALLLHFNCFLQNTWVIRWFTFMPLCTFTPNDLRLNLTIIIFFFLFVICECFNLLLIDHLGELFCFFMFLIFLSCALMMEAALHDSNVRMSLLFTCLYNHPTLKQDCKKLSEKMLWMLCWHHV